jgi:hypothetical protein
LIVPRLQDRLAAVQFDFSGGKRRTYRLLYRPGSRLRPGYWQVRSWTGEDLRRARLGEQFDLRHADPTCIGEDDEGKACWVAGWSDAERDMLGADLEVVFKSSDKHPLP